MADNSEWLTGFNDKLKERTEELSGRNYRFFQIKRLARMAEKVDEYSTSCRDCFFFKDDLSGIAANKENFLDNSMSGNNRYENIFGHVFRHLKKEHKLYPKSHFYSVYSLVGMLFGTLTGLLIAYMILFIQEENNGILKTGILLGWVIGLVFGQIFGKRRDNEMKKQGRQL